MTSLPGPNDRRARRRNRLALLGLVVPSVALLVAALVASGVAESNQPSGPHLSVPAGWRLVRDDYFSYAVPGSWKNNPEYTDSVGDVETSGPDGFAGEHLGYRSGPPAAGEAPPGVLAAFGELRPQPYQLGPATPVSVRGADAAFGYTMTRPGGYQARVVDAWRSGPAVEIWLVVYAPPAEAAAVVASLTG